MFTYSELKEKPKEFLAATGLKVEEFEAVLAEFERAYEKVYPPELNYAGKARQRRAGGGDKSVLAASSEKLLFILIYQKTNPLQTMHGLHFGLSQPQTNYWIHRLLPVLKEALSQMKLMPEREATQVAARLTGQATPASGVVDATERRRNRPVDAAKQQAHYSGKKKAHTDKNIVLVDEATGQVRYLGPTLPGKVHDKKAIDEQPPVFPVNATLGQDTGFQGYAPPGVHIEQPKKNRKERR